MADVTATAAACFECRRVVSTANLVTRASDGKSICPPCAARELK